MAENIRAYDQSTNSRGSVKQNEDSLKAIDMVHARIHEGKTWFLSAARDLTASSDSDLLVVTSAGPEVHVRFAVATEAETTIAVFESVTASAPGTPVNNLFNRNRNSSNSTTVLAYDAPTIVTTGTQIVFGKTGSGKQAGGEIAALAELIVKKDTVYLFRIHNDTPSVNWAYPQISWYEID